MKNPKGEKKDLWKEVSAHAVRFLMMPRSALVPLASDRSMTLPQFSPNVGNAFGQTRSYGPMAPGLTLRLDFTTNRMWTRLSTEDGFLRAMTSLLPPYGTNRRNSTLNLPFEPVRGLKILLTSNLTDNRTRQVQFMYSDMPTSRTGSYTRTHWAFATALKKQQGRRRICVCGFHQVLENIPVAASRVEAQYRGHIYPTDGFMEGNPLGGTPYNPENGTVSATSSDVLIPAFVSAYSGQDINKITPQALPRLGPMRPNWRITYDGFRDMGNMKKWFKTFTLTHAYQCTYSVGSYGSYLNWLSVDGDCGFILDEQSQMPIPSSPYNITSRGNHGEVRAVDRSEYDAA